VPPGEHANVNVSPSLPLSDVAFASHVVGFPSPAEDGEDGPVFELSAELVEWPPPPVPAALFSLFGFEQPALPSTIAASTSTSTTPMIRRRSFIDGVMVNILSGFAQKVLIVQYLNDADCGLPPHSAERLGLSGSDLSPLFLRLSLRRKSFKKNLAESHRHSALCGGKPRPNRSCRLRLPTAHCPEVHHLILKFHKFQADLFMAPWWLIS